ncbi:hypothetical protein QVD17_41582 [Tagetes erecta]|uniref:Uncharacterized protein n=1 Tax=Tagetes erecta TaxID=13708 RepID=A0AAD8JMR8_TARER|nr:hypothetical protein QVD17_41582 [Tagetes erecta]
MVDLISITPKGFSERNEVRVLSRSKYINLVSKHNILLLMYLIMLRVERCIIGRKVFLEAPLAINLSRDDLVDMLLLFLFFYKVADACVMLQVFRGCYKAVAFSLLFQGSDESMLNATTLLEVVAHIDEVVLVCLKTLLQLRPWLSDISLRVFDNLLHDASGNVENFLLTNSQK